MVTFDDGSSCAPGSRTSIDACLAEKGFCARDVTTLDPALSDLAVVSTHGAVDCAGYYVLASRDHVWIVLAELHRFAHHDPREGNLELGKIEDHPAPTGRVTTISYSIERVDPDAPEARDQHKLLCSWPTESYPVCKPQ